MSVISVLVPETFDKVFAGGTIVYCGQGCAACARHTSALPLIYLRVKCLIKLSRECCLYKKHMMVFHNKPIPNTLKSYEEY